MLVYICYPHAVLIKLSLHNNFISDNNIEDGSSSDSVGGRGNADGSTI